MDAAVLEPNKLDLEPTGAVLEHTNAVLSGAHKRCSGALKRCSGPTPAQAAQDRKLVRPTWEKFEARRLPRKPKASEALVVNWPVWL